MKLTIDAERCSGQGRCYSMAPEVYEADDEGYVTQRGQTFDIPPGRERAARVGALNCPEQAITVVES